MEYSVRNAETGTECFTANFLEVLTRRGLRLTPPCPVSAGDRTVSFVNATLTPFKDALGAGEDLGSLCHVQPCVRAHGHEPWLYTFDMVGALGDHADRAAVIGHTVEALLAAAPWIAPKELAALTDPADTGLHRLLRDAGVRLREVADRPDLTCWQYGDGYPLEGRGCTLVAPVRGRPCCSAECGPGCDCGRVQEIGNIILVRGARRSYVETAFGVESVRALAHGGDLYALPELARECARLVALGYSDARARQVVNLRRVLERLHRDGARPSGRGPGHVMRDMVKSAFDLVTGGGGDWGAGVERCSLGPVVTGLLRDEGLRRETSRERSVRSAARLVRRRAGSGRPVGRDELRGTFGLSAEDAQEVLAAASSPAAE